MSDEEYSLVPERQVCEERIDMFVDVTQSNSAVAQQFLQENDWKLEEAVQAFFQALSQETGDASVLDESVVEDLFGKGKFITNEPPPRLHLISWNIDCLDDRNLKRRMANIVSFLKKLEPDVVFLQEVIDEVAEYFERKLPEYKMVRGNEMGYFTVIMLRVFTIKYDNHTVVNYNGSSMGRNALVCSAHVGRRKFALINTHLESGKEFSEERQRQLKQAFSIGDSIPSEVSIIMGGDLNLRDSEACIPNGYFDVWTTCGSRPEAQYTWDTTRNTNKGIGSFGRGPRCRFDRIYIRPEPRHIRFKDFGLIGLTRVPKTQMFPSDHWGLRAEFELKHQLS